MAVFACNLGQGRSTSTARLWSDIDTLVLRCQHTCMVVLARWCVCLSSEVREEFMSSSDSCSRETSSDDPKGGRMEDRKLCRGEEGEGLTARLGCLCPNGIFCSLS